MSFATESTVQQNFSVQDERWMRLALLHASRAQGRSWPNPAVGCVLISAQNRLLAVGATQAGGRPHAEADALMMADKLGVHGELAGGTAYVTLEPCVHDGRGPACAELLIQRRLNRIVYAIQDPDERVNGKGRACLMSAGLSVNSGLYAEDAATILSGFLSSKRTSKPHLCSKIATSVDGFISAKVGQKTWLTNEVSWAYVHDFRSRVDAVLTGIGTVLVDDPVLSCRLSGEQGRTPVRIVLDSDLRLPLDSQLVRTVAEGQVIVFCSQDADKMRQTLLENRGVKIVRLPHENGRLSLKEAMSWCEQNDLYALLLESGAELNTSFFKAGLLDRIVHLTANIALNTGIPGLLYDSKNRSVLAFPDKSAYICVTSTHLGDDRLTIWQSTD